MTEREQGTWEITIIEKIHWSMEQSAWWQGVTIDENCCEVKMKRSLLQEVKSIGIEEIKELENGAKCIASKT